MHAEYQCSIIYTSEDMYQVQVFVADGQILFVISAEAFVSERWISCNLYIVIEHLLDKGHVAKNLQKECLFISLY